MLAAIVRLCRPKQWVKNALIFAAPLAAGAFGSPGVVTRVAIAFATFCAASSATYVINDIRDVESDRKHPRKRLRPIASGAVPIPVAWVVAAVLFAAAAVGAMASYSEFRYILLAYVLLTLSYSFGIKHISVVEMVALVSGFVLRGFAGAAAARVPVSPWFFVVVSAGAMMIIAAKRSGELKSVGDGSGTRKVLSTYTPQFLRSIETAALSTGLIGYCLWAFESATTVKSGSATVVLFRISVAPFATAFFRFQQLADAGEAEAPEDLITDKILAGCGLAWGLIYGCGILLR